MKINNLKDLIKKRFIWSAFIGFILLINYPWFYFGSPIEGRVIDQDGKPLVGVVAVFEFSVTGPRNVFHGRESFAIGLMEVVTDQEGYYEFPWWVTKKRPFKALFRSGSGIGFYKSGYKRNISINLNRDIGKRRLRMITSFKHSKDPVMLEKYTEEVLKHYG